MKQQAEEGGREHAADDAGADRMARIRTGAGRNGQRQHAHDEGERRHQDRAQSQLRGFHDGLAERLAFAAFLDRELDDQDRVLRRKADDRDQADLEVDVVRQAAHHRAAPPHRARRPARRAAPTPAPTSFRTTRPGTGTPPRSTATINIVRLVAGEDFLVRLARPVVTETGWQLGARRSSASNSSPRPNCAPATANRRSPPPRSRCSA